MDQQDKERSFYLRLWCLAISALLLTFLGCAVRNDRQEERIDALVRAGAPAISARCSIEGIPGDARSAICLAAAQAGR